MTVSNFYKNTFGQKVYKISLDGGCTCPNRDGSKGLGGCSFCGASGSGDFVPSRSLSITQQVEQAKKLLSAKLKNQNAKYIAYFQNFTNTYGTIKELSKKWEEALLCENVVGLALGTRPDCLSSECIEVLGKIAESKFLQVELGLQTSNQKTADLVNRCYKNEDYFNAVKFLHSVNPKIHVVTHIIFGLPGEAEGDMLKTVGDAVAARTDGIKITNLYVVRGAKLQKEYEEGRLKLLTEDEYFKTVSKAVTLIPENIIIHRLTGDPPKRDLIAPEWVRNKKHTLNIVNRILINQFSVDKL